MSITAIKSGIKSLAPTYDSNITIGAWGFDTDNPVRAILNESECPLRMCLAPDDKQRSQYDTISIGATQKMTWEILDRLYMFPANLDKGIENYNFKIDLYKESYALAVKANRCLSTTNAKVDQIRFDGPYVITFPSRSGGVPFYVVDALVVVEEFI